MVALRSPLPLLVAALLAAAWAPIARAVSVGTLDDFEDGTTQGWQIGSAGPTPVDPRYVADGGPAGAGDGFLQLTAVGGFGPGSRLSVFNLLQWTSNYLAAGVGAISLDVNNTGATDLVLRFMISDPFPGSPADSALTAGVAVPAGSGWRSIAFSLAPQDLVRRSGTIDLALSGASELRLIHAPTAVFPGPVIAASLGVDNVRALAQVPEPATGSLGAAGLLALAALRRTAPRDRCRRGAAASR